LQLLTILFTAFIVGFSGAMMPGPLLTVNISESARKGAKIGLLLMIGHAVLELALIIGLVVGLKKYLHNSTFITAVSVTGGLFLLWMGYGMVRDSLKGKVALDFSVKQEKTFMGPVIMGILVSLSNPYWTIWWATFGLSYITKAWVYGFAGVAAFYLGHILADFSWYGAVSLAVAKGRGLMSNRLYSGILTVCGLFLIGLAVTFIYSGVAHLIVL
jgi:threonine/homoserine/homoserine lactone efflux protein